MLELGYILLTLLMALIILIGYYKTAKKTLSESTRKSHTIKIALGLFLWFLYCFLLGISGFLQTFELPPRFPLLTVLPAFLFIGFFLKKHKDSAIIENIPTPWLVYYQSFRIIIESLFVATVAVGFLNPEVTFEGYNYDILFGLSAVIVGFLAFNRKVISNKGLLVWNYLGLVVIAFIIFLFTTTAFFPELWGSVETLAKKEAGSFPFVLVPAFLMPSAVFMHVVSIIQLRKKIKL